METCSKCGSEVAVYEKFCLNCGYPQQDKLNPMVEECQQGDEFYISWNVEDDFIRKQVKAERNFKLRLTHIPVVLFNAALVLAVVLKVIFVNY